MSIEIVLCIIEVPRVRDEGYGNGIHFKSSLRTLVPSLQVRITKGYHWITGKF